MAQTLNPPPGDLDLTLASAWPGTTIQLAKGVYTTRGNWAAGRERGYRQLAPGVTLAGAGIDDTILKLAADAEKRARGVERPDRDLSILWAGDGVSVSNLTLAGNTAAIPNWYVNGIRFFGRFELTRVRIVDLRGSWHDDTTLSKEIEVFAVSSVEETRGSRVQEVEIRDVVPGSYVSGIFLGWTETPAANFAGAQPRPGSITECTVDLGRDNQFGFSANQDVLIRRCTCTGGRYGFYNDTGHT